MKVLMVKKFICDFCGRKRYAVGAMRKHEKHCTKNPNRECRMCAKTPDGRVSDSSLLDLIAILSCDIDSPRERMKQIRDKCSCPACILAAIRQSGIWDKYRKAHDDCGVDFEDAQYVHHAYHWLPPVSDSMNDEKFLGFEYKAEKDFMLREFREEEMGAHY